MGFFEIIQVLYWIKTTLSRMETPIVRRRITPRKVEQDFESHLNDSGIGNSPGFEGDALPTSRVGPGTPNYQECRPTSISQGCSPVKSEFPMSVYREKNESRPSLKRALSIWFLFALVGCCLMNIAWTHFPYHEIVRQSCRNATIVLGSVASVILLLIIIVSWKYVGTSSEANDQVTEIHQESDFGLFGGKASNNPKGTYQEPNVVGHLRPNAPNVGQGSPGIGHDLELPFADATPIKRTQHEMSSRVNEYPVRRTFSGANNDVWNEFNQYFENIAELNSWGQEKSRRVLLSTLRGQAESFAYGIPLAVQKDYEQLKQKMEQRFGHSAMKERYIADTKLRKRQSGESLRDFGQAIEDLYRRA